MKEKLIVLFGAISIGMGQLIAQTPAMASFSPDNKPIETATTTIEANFDVIQPSSSSELNVDFELNIDGSVLFYDMDNDGDDDVLQYGQSNSGSSEANVYRNMGDGHFQKTNTSYDLSSIFAVELNYPISAQGDLNGDGINDLIIGGPNFRFHLNASSSVPTHIYWGTSDAGLVENTDLVLPSAAFGDISLIDFNQDTYLDIFITGTNAGNGGVYLYLNDGNGNFTHDESAVFDFRFPAAHAVSSAYDGGKRDLVISGYNLGFAKVTALYQYDGVGAFNLVSDSFFPGFFHGNHQFSDADGDGDQDFLMEGLNLAGGESTYYHQLYWNNGDGNYELSMVDLDGILEFNRMGSVFKDLNNDGAAEIIMIQRNYRDEEITKEPALYVLKNDGTGQYDTPDAYEGLYNGFVMSVGDLNGDGYLDIFHRGFSDNLDAAGNLYLINDQENGFVKSELHVTDELSESDLKFSDVDRDGDLDLLMIGKNNNEEQVAKLYTNDGSGNYELNESTPFEGAQYASIDFSDVDNNGFEDVLLTGLSASDIPIANLYLNTNSSFSIDVGAPFTGISHGQVEFFDADGDNDEDVLLVGEDASAAKIAQLYTNDGDGNFTLSTSGIDGASQAAFTTGDVDGDKDADVIVIGLNDSDEPFSTLYLNDGNGSFSADVSNNFIAVSDGDVELEDIDNDGDSDLLISGSGDQMTYKNDGLGNFSFSQQLEGLYFTAVDFADVDLDGDQDFVASGAPLGKTHQVGANTLLYINDGTGSFTKSEDVQFFGLRRGAVTFADIDNDFDEDLLISGNALLDESNTARLYRNTVCTTETIELQPVVSCEAYNFHGTQLSVTGVYEQAFETADGCNRTVSLDFTFQGNIVVEELEVCDSYEFDGVILTTTGQYQGVFTNMYNCDSLVTLNLTIVDGACWESNAWSNGSGPIATDNVLILSDYSSATMGSFVAKDLKVAAGVNFNIDAGTVVEVKGNVQNNGSMSVLSGGTYLTYDGFTHNGNGVTIKRNTRFSDNRYSFVGSPVQTDASITGAQLGQYVYSYNETISYNDGTEDGVNRWTDASSTILKPGAGYAAAGQQEITFVGSPNNGTITMNALSRTEDATTTANNWGWHLVSNPYAAAIDFDAFINGNTGIQGSIAFWDDSGITGRGTNADYLVVNTIGSSGGNGTVFSGYMGSMQGFFVQVGDGDTGNLQFTESMRVNGQNADNTFLREAGEKIPSINLIMTDQDGHYSETLVGFPIDATEDLDHMYDAVKLKSQHEFNIYSFLNEHSLAIQGLPLKQSIIIPLGIDMNESHQVTFKAISSGRIIEPYQIFIRDHNTSMDYPLSEQENVTLTISEGQNQQQFSLVVRSSEILYLPNDNSRNFTVFMDDSYINISGERSDRLNLKLINMGGQTVLESSDLSMSANSLQLKKPTHPGVYVLVLSSEYGTEVHKVINR